MSRTNTTTHLYVGEAVADPLTCQHDSGEFSFRIVEGVWLTGTPAEFRAFADRLVAIADEVTRGDQFTDQDDFDQSRADHEALL